MQQDSLPQAELFGRSHETMPLHSQSTSPMFTKNWKCRCEWSSWWQSGKDCLDLSTSGIRLLSMLFSPWPSLECTSHTFFLSSTWCSLDAQGSHQANTD